MAGVKAFSEAEAFGAGQCFTDQRLIVRRHAQGCKAPTNCSSTDLKQAGALCCSDLFCGFGIFMLSVWQIASLLVLHIGLH